MKKPFKFILPLMALSIAPSKSVEKAPQLSLWQELQGSWNYEIQLAGFLIPDSSKRGSRIHGQPYLYSPLPFPDSGMLLRGSVVHKPK
jgi:hypothetical protein